MWLKVNFNVNKIMKDIINNTNKSFKIEVKCINCENIIWNYSYNYLKEKWELFCDNCNNNFLVDLNFKIK